MMFILVGALIDTPLKSGINSGSIAGETHRKRDNGPLLRVISISRNQPGLAQGSPSNRVKPHKGLAACCEPPAQFDRQLDRQPGQVSCLIAQGDRQWLAGMAAEVQWAFA